MSILLIGATGKIGREACRRIVSSGFSPIAGVRDPDQAKALLPDGTGFRKFDFNLPETYASLVGIRRVYFVAVHKDPVPSVQQFLKACKMYGVEHILFSSGRTTGDVPGKPLHTIEGLVRSSGMTWTIFRPGWFMQNFATWLGEFIIPEGKIYLPAADSKTAFVDVRDLGAAAAEVLTGEGHQNRLYNLVSEEAIDHYQVAAMISEASGRRVSYQALEREAFIQLMAEKGWTTTKASYTADLYDLVRTGKEEELSPDLRQILGRPPISFRQFAEDYAQVWQ